ncbi:MAG: hypothetical protein ACYTEW_17190, partial [Planctomycetota bacterium]|jgi:hypothetical protein
VKDKHLISKKGFKDLKASDKFRLLLGSLDIPLQIPTDLKDLKVLARNHKWVDAAQALSEIRNNIVHPIKKFEFQPRHALYQGWNLGLWYVELVLLRLFDYRGEYSNRLTPDKLWGKLEMVPWAFKEEGQRVDR